MSLPRLTSARLPDDWSTRVVRELKKHAERDECYSCKKLIRELCDAHGISQEELFK